MFAMPGSKSKAPARMEEGQWLVTLTGATGGPLTYTTQVGRYRRRGSIVDIHGTILISGGVAIGGAVSISLPFLASNEAAIDPVISFGNWNFTLTANYTSVNGLILPNTQAMLVYQCGSAQAPASIPAASVGAGSQCIFSGSYRIA